MKFDLTKKQHKALLLLFAFISFGCATLISKIPVSNVFIEIPGFFAIFIFLLFGFDRYWWKWEWLKQAGVIDFPNLNGSYDGSFSSSFKDPKTGKKYEGTTTLFIRQTASEIVVNGEFNKSKSVSTQASFGFNDIEGKVCLYYFFKNKPGEKATETMHAHEGSTILCYDEKSKELTGEYYSGRDRNNYGDIKVQKK